MRKPKHPDPPHILDYIARIKVEAIDIKTTISERMEVLGKTRSLST